MACGLAAALAKKKESDKRRKMWVGGDVEDEMSENDHPKDSTGEPNTNDYEEEKQPMEYMADGGMTPPTSYNYEKDKKDESEMDSGIKFSAGGLARTREKERFQAAAKMLDGGEVVMPQPKPRPGIGKGGGLKGAFEHDDDVPPAKPQTPPEKPTYGYMAGGLAKSPEKRDPQASPYGDTGGHYVDSEDDSELPEDEEEMPHMMAGGDAALPEERHLEDDSLEDVDSNFIADFLRRKRNRMSTPSY